MGHYLSERERQQRRDRRTRHGHEKLRKRHIKVREGQILCGLLVFIDWTMDYTIRPDQVEDTAIDEICKSCLRLYKIRTKRMEKRQFKPTESRKNVCTYRSPSSKRAKKSSSEPKQ